MLLCPLPGFTALPMCPFCRETTVKCVHTSGSIIETAEAGVMNGALVENFAVSEIMKGYQNAGLDPALSFYRDRDGKEIDLILERDGALLPVEIKKTASPDRRLFKTFEILARANQALGTGSVLCLSDHAGGFAPDQLIVPIGSL